MKNMNSCFVTQLRFHLKKRNKIEGSIEWLQMGVKRGWFGAKNDLNSGSGAKSRQKKGPPDGGLRSPRPLERGSAKGIRWMDPPAPRGGTSANFLNLIFPRISPRCARLWQKKKPPWGNFFTSRGSLFYSIFSPSPSLSPLSPPPLSLSSLEEWVWEFKLQIIVASTGFRT